MFDTAYVIGMFIQTEQTPNPATIKFLPGQTVLERGVAEFHNEEEAENAPMAQRLLALDGVRSVFFGGDFISVTKDDDADWELLKTHVLGEVMQHLTAGLPIMNKMPEPSGGSVTEDDDELVVQIKELLDTRIRPAVAGDGGDISFVRFDDGVVYLKMQGACAGCPSATATLKHGIENMLRHYVPEVVRVEQEMEL